MSGGLGPCYNCFMKFEKIRKNIIVLKYIMPKKNNKLNQDLKELEEKEKKVLSMFGFQINPNTWQTFMNMEKEIIKEINRENRHHK